MKQKALFAVILASAASIATAQTIGVQTGQIFKQGTHVTTVSAVQPFLGLDFGTSLQVSDKGRFKAADLTVGKKVASLGPVDFSVKGGFGYVNPGLEANGYVGVLGLQASYPLTKEISLVASSVRDFGLRGNRGLSYTVNQVGLNYSF